MRRTTDWGTFGGRPSLTPAAFLAASAFLVRWPISRRSNCPKVARQHVRSCLSGGGRGVEGAVERYQRPALLLCRRHQRCEVEYRARETVELRYDQGLRFACLERPRQDAGAPLELFAGEGR